MNSYMRTSVHSDIHITYGHVNAYIVVAERRDECVYNCMHAIGRDEVLAINEVGKIMW